MRKPEKAVKMYGNFQESQTVVIRFFWRCVLYRQCLSRASPARRPLVHTRASSYVLHKMAAMSVTMAGVLPVGVKQTRVSRASRSAMPVKAHLGSAFTAGGRVDFNGQKLSLGVAPGTRKAGSRCVTSMAAKVAGYIKLAIEAGKANPAPPIGPALGAKVR